MNRLKILREERGLNQADLGKLLNITSQAYGLYENEKRTINNETLLILSDFYNCSIDYILGKTDTTERKFFKCPVYGQIPAGKPNWAEECLEGYIPLDPNLMSITNPEECFFLRVNGESMNKIIANGSYALIRKQSEVENGEIAVVLVDEFEATLKRFNQNENIVVLSPSSNSAEFEPIVVDISQTEFKILGKYIGKFEMK